MFVPRRCVALFIEECDQLTPTDRMICLQRLEVLDEGTGAEELLDLEEVVETVFRGYPDVGELAVESNWDRWDVLSDQEFGRAVQQLSRMG